MKFLQYSLLAVLVGSFCVTGAKASINLGGMTFDDNAFADELISSFGSFTVGGGATTVEEAVVGHFAGDYAFSFTSGAYLEVGFTDNFIINLAGDDFTIFELGIAASVPVSLTLGGTTVTKTLTDTGFNAGGFDLNSASWDLDEFGLSANALVSSLVIEVDATAGGSLPIPSITAIAANNSAANPAIPEPTSVLVWSLLSLAAVQVNSRRKKKV